MSNRANPCSVSTRSPSILLATLALLALTASWLASCAPAAEAPAGAAPPTGAAGPAAPPIGGPALSGPVDLDAVIRSARSAFRPEGGAWLGGGATYAVRAVGGDLEVRPLDTLPRGPGRSAPAPLAIAVARVTRGDHELAGPTPAADPRAAPDGHLVVQRGGFDQHLRNADAGTELSFSFAQRPPGAGDLSVRLDVSGQVYAAETAAGHHFTDPASGLGVLIGRARWIDAHGAGTDLRTRAVAGGLEILVPAAVVDASAYPAILDPLISPEIALDQPVQGPAAGQQLEPAVAFDGATYLVVWTDEREARRRVRAARVTAAGALLDPYGIALGDGRAPDVAFDGTNFLVAFSVDAGITSSWGTLSRAHAIRAARVSPSGVVLDVGGFPVSAAADGDTVSAPAVSSDGGAFLVAWSQWQVGSPGETRFARVTSGGAVLDPGGALIATSPTGAPAVSFDGAGYLVVWPSAALGNGTETAFAARVTPGGAVLDPGGLALGGSNLSVVYGTTGPRVAFDGLHHVVVWWECAADCHLWARRITPQGVLLGAADLLVEPIVDDLFVTMPYLEAIAFDGESTLIAWSRQVPSHPGLHRSPVKLARIDLAGAMIPPGPVLLADDAAYVALSPGDAGAFAVWSDLSSGLEGRYAGLLATRLGAAGAPLDDPPLQLTRGANTEAEPSVTFDGHSFLVAWRDTRSWVDGSDAIVGARVTPAGTVLDASGLVIAVSPSSTKAPVAVFDGLNTLVLWLQGSPTPLCDPCEYSLWGARVTPAGDALPPARLASPLYSAFELTAASTGDGVAILVGGEDALLRVGQDGSVTGPWPIFGSVTVEDHHWSSPTALAARGQDLLITWVDLPDTEDDDEGERIFAARVDAQNVVLDPGGVLLVPSSGAEELRRVAAVTDEVLYLIAWRSCEGDVARVRATRVAADGTLLDPQPLLLAERSPSGDCALPAWAEGMPLSAVFDGSRFLVVWRQRDAADPFHQTDLFGVEITPQGVAAAPFAITADPAWESTPAIASLGAGESLVAYTRFVEEAPYNAERALVRRLGACDPAACPTGHCVDGVCCDTLCGGGDPLDCVACSVAFGAPADGVCAPLDGVACDDMNACSEGDVCHAGACAPGAPTVCAPADECHEEAACDPTVGCAGAAKPDGAPCTGGVCLAGVCTAAGAGGAGGAGGDPSDPPRSPSSTAGCHAAEAPPPTAPWSWIVAACLLAARRRQARAAAEALTPGRVASAR